VAAQAPQAPTYGYRIVQQYPHDPAAFTQGLIYRDGFLFESTGLNGQSSLRKVDLQTGEVVQRHEVESTYFAEGLTDWRDSLVQLTWQANLAFVYDLTTFEVANTFRVAGPGWGLTHDNARLIVSDGTDVLRFLDPETHEVTRTLAVRDGGAPVDQLNELEFVKGERTASPTMRPRTGCSSRVSYGRRCSRSKSSRHGHGRRACGRLTGD
jgi:glutaminyl-peptide cyclotransferase